jgi:hypothetical protein
LEKIIHGSEEPVTVSVKNTFPAMRTDGSCYDAKSINYQLSTIKKIKMKKECIQLKKQRQRGKRKKEEEGK